MRRYLALNSLIVIAFLLATRAGWAACATTATAAALDEFVKNPQQWIDTHKQDANIGDEAEALAAAAVNAKSPTFGKAFGAALGHASAKVGKSVGTSIKGLVGSCTDPNDPGDAKDKAYINDNIIAELPLNAAANASYGLSEAQTAATGAAGGGGLGGGGGGTGVGSVGTGAQSGGSNTGASTAVGGSTSTPTAAESVTGFSAGSLSVL